MRCILVVSPEEINISGDKYKLLWDVLDSAKEANISYKKTVVYSWEDSYENCRGYDSYIFIDFDESKIVDFNAPFIEISSLNDEDDDIIFKVQCLAKYMSDPDMWEGVKDTDYNGYAFYVPESLKEDTIISVEELGFQVTLDDVKNLKFKDFIVNIDGKDVKISKEEITSLCKIYNLIDKFGYKIKRVVV
jgi:hypothetical protein